MPDPAPFTIRRATPADYEPLMRLINGVFFGADPHGFANFLPNLYRDPAVATAHAYLALDGTRMVGHVGVYPLVLRSGAVELRTGGIGAVAADPAVRGQGIMSRLLNEAIAGMAREGYDVSVLWGDRTRYAAFGWEVFGRRVEWRFDERAAMRQKVEPVELTAFRPAVHAADAARLWNADPVGTVHATDDLVQILTGPRWRAVVTTGTVRALAVYSPGDEWITVHKLVGAADLLPGVLLALRQRLDPERGKVRVIGPAGDHALPALGERLGAEFSQAPVGQLRILNLPAVLGKLQAAFGAPPSAGALRCTVSGESAAATLGTGAAAELALDHPQWVRALFGTPLDRPAPAALAGWPLPLPLHIEQPATV